MTLLQLLTFLYYHAELTAWLGFLFLALLYALERIISRLIALSITLAREKTKQLTTQLEIEMLRPSKPKQEVMIPDGLYDQGYQA